MFGRHRVAFAWALMLPLVGLQVLVVLGPSLASVFYSMTEWSGIGPADWIGFDNYLRIAGDPEVRRAFTNNLIWTALYLTVPLALGLLGAFMLSRITRFQLAFRLAYFVPYVIAGVVNGAIWKNLLDPSRGVLSALGDMGVPGLGGVAFLGNTTLALPTVAFVDIWHSWGFVVVIFLAAMQSVDRSLYEAARVDGASVWQEFWNITIPGIRPTLAFIVLMLVVWSLLTFDYVWILTQGGPAGASEVSSTVLYKNAFQRREAGYAAAIGIALTAVTALVMSGYLLARRRGWDI